MVIWKYLKFYAMFPLIGFAFAGFVLGGHWLWLGTAVLLFIMVFGDPLLGEDTSHSKFKVQWLLEVPLYGALPCLAALLVLLAWVAGAPGTDFLGIGAFLSYTLGFDVLATRQEATWIHLVGAAISCGFFVGGWGINVGHELTHRVYSPVALNVGRWLLSMACNADFSIEHVYGHHARVGTAQDPATARKGENVYSFALRSTIFGHLSAWEIESKRLRKRKKKIWSFDNKMLTGYLMSLTWLAMFAFAAGGLGVALFLGQAAFAKFLLEAVNYMEHYGLKRKPGERIQPHHSWNSNKLMSSMVLFSLTRHSAHHEKGHLPFWVLNPYPDAPQMRYGYLTTILLCLVPPLWFRVIRTPLAEWESRYQHGH